MCTPICARQICSACAHSNNLQQEKIVRFEVYFALSLHYKLKYVMCVVR